MNILIGIILFAASGAIYADSIITSCDELGNCATGVIIDVPPPTNWPFKDVPPPQ